MVLLLVGLQYIDAAWTGPQPTGTIPPANNVAAPVNVGSITQVKSGDLGVSDFIADSVLSAGNVQSNTQMQSPKYCDLNGENCWPSTTNGTTTDEIIVGGICFKPSYQVVCNWNWGGGGNDDSSYIFPISQGDPSTYCPDGNHGVYRRHSIILAECESTYYRWNVSSYSCNAPSPQTCEYTTGTKTRTVTCVNSAGQAVADSFCSSKGTKPSTQGGSCTKFGGNSSSC